MKSEKKSKAHLKRNAIIREALSQRQDKSCSRCHLTKPIDHFNRLNGTLDGRNYHCKKCDKKRRATWYYKRGGKDKEKARQKKRFIQHRIKVRSNMWTRKAKLVELAGGCCVDCGLRPGAEWPLSCFEFHHTGPRTVKSMQLLIRSEKSMPKAIEEIKNCVLLCSNCHQRRHVSSYHPTLT